MRNGRASSFFFLAVIGCLLMVGGIGVDRWMLTGSRPHDRWHGDTAHAEGVIGMTVDEVIQRYGEPASRQFGRWDHAFRLGSLGHIEIDGVWLVIATENGQVVEAGVIAD